MPYPIVSLERRVAVLGRDNPFHRGQDSIWPLPVMLPLDLWSGRRRNTIARANTSRRSMDGYQLPDLQRKLWGSFRFNDEENPSCKIF